VRGRHFFVLLHARVQLGVVAKAPPANRTIPRPHHSHQRPDQVLVEALKGKMEMYQGIRGSKREAREERK